MHSNLLPTPLWWAFWTLSSFCFVGPIRNTSDDEEILIAVSGAFEFVAEYQLYCNSDNNVEGSDIDGLVVHKEYCGSNPIAQGVNLTTCKQGMIFFGLFTP